MEVVLENLSPMDLTRYTSMLKHLQGESQKMNCDLGCSISHVTVRAHLALGPSEVFEVGLEKARQDRGVCARWSDAIKG